MNAAERNRLFRERKREKRRVLRCALAPKENTIATLTRAGILAWLEDGDPDSAVADAISRLLDSIARDVERKERDSVTPASGAKENAEHER